MRRVLQFVALALILMVAGVPAMAVVYARCTAPAMPCCAMHDMQDAVQEAQTAPCCVVSANPAPTAQIQAPTAPVAPAAPQLVVHSVAPASHHIGVAVSGPQVENGPSRSLLCTFLI